MLRPIETAPTDGTVIFMPTDMGYPVPIAWIHYHSSKMKERSFWDLLLGRRFEHEYTKEPKSWCIVTRQGVLQTGLKPAHWYKNPQAT